MTWEQLKEIIDKRLNECKDDKSLEELQAHHQTLIDNMPKTPSEVTKYINDNPEVVWAIQIRDALAIRKYELKKNETVSDVEFDDEGTPYPVK